MHDEPLVLENEFTCGELDVLRSLAERQDLTRVQTLRQALRLYQSVILGHSTVVNPPSNKASYDGLQTTGCAPTATQDDIRDPSTESRGSGVHGAGDTSESAEEGALANAVEILEAMGMQITLENLSDNSNTPESK